MTRVPSKSAPSHRELYHAQAHDAIDIDTINVPIFYTDPAGSLTRINNQCKAVMTRFIDDPLAVCSRVWGAL